MYSRLQGDVHSLVCKYETTIDELLKKYLHRVNKPELINSEKICFLFNASQLKFGDKTKIEDFFKGNSSPTIIVDEVNSILC